MKISFDLDGVVADADAAILGLLHDRARAGVPGADVYLQLYYQSRRVLINPLDFMSHGDELFIVTGRLSQAWDWTRDWVRARWPNARIIFVATPDLEALYVAGQYEQASALAAALKSEAIRRIVGTLSLDPVDAAWLAALIDGEGCIQINRNMQVVLMVGQANTECVQRAAAITGLGVVNCFATGGGHRPTFRWTVTDRRAAVILKAIYPWLLLKRGQAVAAIELAERKYLGTNHLGEEEKAIRNNLRQTCLDLNASKSAERRGPLQNPNFVHFDNNPIIVGLLREAGICAILFGGRGV